jgi:hypothetical protein
MEIQKKCLERLLKLMADFSPKQIQFSKSRTVNELGYNKTYLTVQNRSSFEIQEVTIKFSYSEPGSGFVSSTGNVSFSKGFAEIQSVQLENLKPGEKRECSFSDSEGYNYSFWKLSGTLADGRPFIWDRDSEDRHDDRTLIYILLAIIIIIMWAVFTH